MAYAATSPKQQAHELIDAMAPGQVSAVVGLLKIMLDPFTRTLANAPIDDEPVSAEEAREIAAATRLACPRRRHPQRGSPRRVRPQRRRLRAHGPHPARTPCAGAVIMAKKIVWTDQAKAQLRAIDKHTALRILHALAKLIDTGEGDVKRLQDIEPPEFRLRVGDYRARFHDFGDAVEVTGVKHRREVYR